MLRKAFESNRVIRASLSRLLCMRDYEVIIMLSPALQRCMSDVDMEEQSGFDLQEHVVCAAVYPCSWCAVTEPLGLKAIPYGGKDI